MVMGMGPQWETPFTCMPGIKVSRTGVRQMEEEEEERENQAGGL